jgi:hypothetical protein
VGAFAYPFGAHDGALRQIVADAGFVTAVTVEARAVAPDDDALLLPRVELRARDLASFEDALERLLAA